MLNSAKQRLAKRDRLRLKAAEYWLALGAAGEAQKELTQIERSHRGHPDVAMVARQIAAQAEDFCAVHS